MTRTRAARHPAASRRCTTTSTTSSGAGASTRTSSTSRRSARSGPALERDGRQRSAVFEAGDVRIVCSQPLGEGGRAWRYLRKHPDGVGTVVFEVEDAERCFRLLEERGGTPDHRRPGAPRRGRHARARSTSRRRSATPPSASSSGAATAGSTRASRATPAPRGGENAFGFGYVDHLTSNFQTMKPALLWMEHVLGLEEFWEVAVPHEGRGRGEARRARGAAGLGAPLRRDARRRAPA